MLTKVEFNIVVLTIGVGALYPKVSQASTSESMIPKSLNVFGVDVAVLESSISLGAFSAPVDSEPEE